MTNTMRVLYVEDEPDIRDVAQLALEDDGFDLIQCASGLEAIEKAQHLNVDLILLDVMMPGLDGPSTLTKLREIPQMNQTPAIFMTAKVQLDEIKRYKSMGALGVIAKPFDPLTLASDLREKLKA